MQKLELVAKSVISIRAGEFGSLKFTSGKIDESEADGRTGGMFGDRCEEIVFPGVEQSAVGGGTRSDDPHDVATDEFLARSRLLHLIADRDFEAGADQTRNVAFGGVVRHATHGNRLALFSVARGESDLEFARCDDRVFVEEFVKIAKAEEQYSVGVARLDGG